MLEINTYDTIAIGIKTLIFNKNKGIIFFLFTEKDTGRLYYRNISIGTLINTYTYIPTSDEVVALCIEFLNKGKINV